MSTHTTPRIPTHHVIFASTERLDPTHVGFTVSTPTGCSWAITDISPNFTLSLTRCPRCRVRAVLCTCPCLHCSNHPADCTCEGDR